MPKNGSFKGDLDLKFLTQARFESLDNANPGEHIAIMGRNALRLLMMGWPESWTLLFSWSIFKAVFIQRNTELLKEFRRAFQQGFEILFKQLEGQTFNNEQHEQIQLYLSNCLSLLPYADLTPYESIKIPQFIDEQWVLVDYYVNPIELTSGRSKKLKDHDRVFAYGLEPINNGKAIAHLVFMGTTYPAGQGFLSQITTDFEAFETVGSSLYLSGRQNILDWLTRQKDKPHVCGVSLGGSLGLLLAIDLGDYLSRVDALNPAGLHRLAGKSKYDHWDELFCKPMVVVQQQKNDPVSLLGVWKPDWDIIKVVPPEGKGGPNSFCDHFLNYAGFAGTEFTYSSAITENNKRTAMNLLLYSIGRSAVYYLFISPYNHILRPAKYSMMENTASYFILLFALLGVGVLVSLPLANVFSPLVLFSAFAFFSLLSGLLFIPTVLNIFMSRQAIQWDDGTLNYASLHDPELPRNPEMDIYNKDNSIEINFTYKELNSYYKMMRCLVKGKDFLLSDELNDCNEPQLSKKQWLIESEKPENANETVILQATKAKAIHMKHVLTFIEQLGMDNENDLKKALVQEYTHYRFGKMTQ